MAKIILFPATFFNYIPTPNQQLNSHLSSHFDPTRYQTYNNYNGITVGNLATTVAGLSSYSFYNIEHNPIDTYMAWNCKPGKEFEEKSTRAQRTFVFSDSIIEQKFWDKKQIEEYVENNLENDVVIQRDNNLWDAIFRTVEEKEKFQEWFDVQSLGRVVKINYKTPKRKLEIDEWILNTSVEYKKNGDTIIFRKEQDRVHFILRWDHVDEVEDE